jgi:hypothetical protein
MARLWVSPRPVCHPRDSRDTSNRTRQGKESMFYPESPWPGLLGYMAARLGVARSRGAAIDMRAVIIAACILGLLTFPGMRVRVPRPVAAKKDG